jgi:hypothetical protein
MDVKTNAEMSVDVNISGGMDVKVVLTTNLVIDLVVNLVAGPIIGSRVSLNRVFACVCPYTHACACACTRACAYVCPCICPRASPCTRTWIWI